MTTFLKQLNCAPVLVDERSGIGPHQLAIGKTRKLFERDGTIYAFYSRGYEIACAAIEARSPQIRSVQVLNLPVAWGGGAFCVDCDSSGRVALIFLHRNQHELCLATGAIENGQIEWAPWRSLLVSSSYQAAPWVELGPDGTAWCSVLDRAGHFRLAVVRDDEMRAGDLFSAEEAPWYHSCVQVLPIGKDRAVAIGFRGAFPARTELVFKAVSAKLELGPSETLAPCNVNDKLTFHFQAVGDPERGCAHIVYLDEGLAVSHARFSDDRWIIARRILAVPSFAPQISVNPRGDLLLLAADYDARIWKASRPFAGDWSEPAIMGGIPGPNISSLFAQTGYGTGGLISAARSNNGRVPFLIADITDERTATAELRLCEVGPRQVLASHSPLTVKEKGRAVEVEIRLAGLSDSDLADRANAWLATIPAQKGRALKIRVAAGKPMSAAASWHEADGRRLPLTMHAAIETSTCDAFSSASHGTIRAVLEMERADAGLQLERAWVETYSGDALVDLGPYQRETAAKLALAPELITRTYKRMV